jgi:hypothetical protein
MKNMTFKLEIMIITQGVSLSFVLWGVCVCVCVCVSVSVYSVSHACEAGALPHQNLFYNFKSPFQFWFSLYLFCHSWETKHFTLGTLLFLYFLINCKIP